MDLGGAVEGGVLERKGVDRKVLLGEWEEIFAHNTDKIWGKWEMVQGDVEEIL